MSRRETKPSATSYLKAANDHQSVDVEFGDVLADLLQPFAWKSSSGIQDTCLFSKYKIKEINKNAYFYLLVPNIEPPFPVQPLTEVQIMGSICSEQEDLTELI